MAFYWNRISQDLICQLGSSPFCDHVTKSDYSAFTVDPRMYVYCAMAKVCFSRGLSSTFDRFYNVINMSSSRCHGFNTFMVGASRWVKTMFATQCVVPAEMCAHYLRAHFIDRSASDVAPQFSLVKDSPPHTV